MSDPYHPDFAAWLAQREAEVSGDHDDDLPPAPYVMMPAPVRGWHRLGDLIAKIGAAVIAGGGAMMIAGAVVYAARAW